MKNTKAPFDLYQVITDKILEEIEKTSNGLIAKIINKAT